jgi:hypothetical protein
MAPRHDLFKISCFLKLGEIGGEEYGRIENDPRREERMIWENVFATSTYHSKYETF